MRGPAEAHHQLPALQVPLEVLGLLGGQSAPPQVAHRQVSFIQCLQAGDVLLAVPVRRGLEHGCSQIAVVGQFGGQERHGRLAAALVVTGNEDSNRLGHQ
jgi:hypothetical protein